jgi:serine protease autotransporter
MQRQGTDMDKGDPATGIRRGMNTGAKDSDHDADLPGGDTTGSGSTGSGSKGTSGSSSSAGGVGG